MEQTKVIIADKGSHTQRCQASWVLPQQNHSSFGLFIVYNGHKAHVALKICPLLMLCPLSFHCGMSVHLGEHHFLLISETFGPLKLKWISVFFMY